MISWMQKHNKYLVWTIWVSTIAFIGAGFVGWGSYDFSTKAGNIAKVGDIEIKQSRFNVTYNNLYDRYNQKFKGEFDNKKAKELGLLRQAFSSVEVQAKLLNYAKDIGLIASDEEVARTLGSIKGFQKDGKFDRSIYDMYLKSKRLKAKVFEEILQDEIIITKLFSLLSVGSLPLEEKAIGAAMSMADKIEYRVLTEDDVNPKIDRKKLKTFWEKNKEQFMTPKRYGLQIVWIKSNNTKVTDDELKHFYETNSFSYTDKKGKQLLFKDAKNKVLKDLKLKKTKKIAQKAYIAFKKGKRQSSEEITLSLNDPKLSRVLWETIQQKQKGDILKPKVVNDRYATVKITAITEPKIMTFKEAESAVTKFYRKLIKKEALLSLAQTTLKTLKKSNGKVSGFINLNKFDNLKKLNSQESLQFLQRLFTSSQKKGTISVSNKIIVYNIIAQKYLPIDNKQDQVIKDTVAMVKQKIFKSNLIKILDTKYPTKVYMGGLTN
ncbi:MAG: peptidylprolyl isomerase [Sulfurovum sp.]|nr:peptidylprolyl isomerase [Sulfurovum sp.]MCB4744301.1 peptidylprolyl isomerase [Sulfurovum sp.]MCB4746288.1 peptidylprolyl isomerase [Sulfurovum sp.]MCB4747079.1 peptidylprolyl isomerase [Sulfurovum sp.]MCB4748718.1 peptidylprolyl isomerase [Sulfurovum sp.]